MIEITTSTDEGSLTKVWAFSAAVDKDNNPIYGSTLTTFQGYESLRLNFAKHTG